MPLQTSVTLEECELRNVRYLAYSSNPEVVGAYKDEFTPKVGYNMYQLHDGIDTVDIVFETQKNGFVHGYDLYSDVVFGWALLHHPMYVAVTSWKKTSWIVFFCISQCAWLAISMLIAKGFTGAHITQKTPSLTKAKLFFKTWFICAFNGQLAKTHALSFATKTSKLVADGAVTISFVPVTSMQEEYQVGAVEMFPMVSTLLLEDVPLLALNVAISLEVGFSFASVPALALGVMGILLKGRDILNTLHLLFSITARTGLVA